MANTCPHSSMDKTSSTSTPENTSSAEDIAVKVVNKRYEGLITVRTKAVKGKGAWYWAHFEPILIRNPETNLPKAVKLKCNLCNAVFSASNPSRTASEHLKRGTCPNFSSVPKPISAVSPSQQLPPLASPSSSSYRKRNSHQFGSTSYSNPHPSFSDDMGFSQQNQNHLVLSGGKDDLGALAMFQDSVKKLKSPKSSPCPELSKAQIDSALNFLADWFYESCGSVSVSSLDHPKFKAFLNQVGLPAVSTRDFLGGRLNSKFQDAKMETEARIREAVFFQISSDGWKSMSDNCSEDNLVKFMVNLPNGSRVFHKAVLTNGTVPSDYAAQILWESVTGLCGSAVHKCVGIVADKYKAKALRNLEIQNHWMVNLSCQLHGFISLIKDFIKELPLVKAVLENCLKIANVFNSKSQVRSSFHKFKSENVELPGFIRVPPRKCDVSKNFFLLTTMMEDILNCARILHLVILDDSYKVLCLEDPVAREVALIIQDGGFWNELEAVHSLIKLIKNMAEEIESERPLVGQCLPLWEDLKAKTKDWCAKFRVPEDPVEKIVERRFKSNYHPAWSAAFILDPQYLTRDSSGKYLPPFKCLTKEQEKDVDSLITRLVPREEAPIALMELMKWRSEGLNPLYAQAVQVKNRDPLTGKMKIANPQSSRLVWETCLKEFQSLSKIAVRLLFLHATSFGFKYNWSSISRLGLDRAQKMIFIAAHSKLERVYFPSEEEKEDGMLNEAFADASSVLDYHMGQPWKKTKRILVAEEALLQTSTQEPIQDGALPWRADVCSSTSCLLVMKDNRELRSSLMQENGMMYGGRYDCSQEE